jgi:hypothetical protein
MKRWHILLLVLGGCGVSSCCFLLTQIKPYRPVYLSVINEDSTEYRIVLDAVTLPDRRPLHAQQVERLPPKTRLLVLAWTPEALRASAELAYLLTLYSTEDQRLASYEWSKRELRAYSEENPGRVVISEGRLSVEN